MRNVGSDSACSLKSITKDFGLAYGTVFTRLDCDNDRGVRLLSQTDTFAAEPLGRVVRKDSMPHPERHKIDRWQILISGAGQMGEGNLFGRSIIADSRLEGAFVGPDTFVISFEEPGSDLNLWTYAVLNSSIGMQGIKASAYGTSIPHLRSDLLGSLPIPVAPVGLMRRVARLIKDAVVHREEYLRHLLHARTIIESLEGMKAAQELCSVRRMRTTLWDSPLPSLTAWTFVSTGGALKLLRDKWSGRVADVVSPDGIFRGGRGLASRVSIHTAWTLCPSETPS
ncbi:hypothetical protein [Bradyrhizobium sp. BR 1433]|uniref:hypothetical protein n=1 Tax=Bradyrhizobium sp. BR 1433 TaxID=3447967 RepID=UPI003EE4F84A